ncbi:MAG: YncE family protein, partial [Comamonadaceae bacterium]
MRLHPSLSLHVLAAGMLALLAGCSGMAPTGGMQPGQRQLMLVANDEKQSWTDAGVVTLAPHGRDSVQLIDIGTDPLAPRALASFALDNTIAGPPTNLAITADERLALVANSLNVVEENGVRKQVPDTR